MMRTTNKQPIHLGVIKTGIYGPKIVKMIVNHWVLKYDIFRQTHNRDRSSQKKQSWVGTRLEMARLGNDQSLDIEHMFHPTIINTLQNMFWSSLEVSSGR